MVEINSENQDFSISGSLWDFYIEPNALVIEGAPCTLLPPIPEVELLRAKVVKEMREHYHSLCVSHEGIDAPAESFNRWIMERKVFDTGFEPLLPSKCREDVSPAMFREIIHDIPIRLSKIKNVSDARRNLFQYAEGARKLLERRGVDFESSKIVKWHTDETLKWLRKDQNASLEDYLNQLHRLRRECGPYLTKVSTPSVEDICKKMYYMSQEKSKLILDKHLSILRQCNINLPNPVQPNGNIVSVRPTMLICPSPALGDISVVKEKGIVSLNYHSDMVKLNVIHYQKLESLYRLSCKDDPKMELIHARMWCLLQRYHTFFGPNQYEGIMLHGSLPTAVFKCLNEEFGVSMECFASPLNCYYKHYLSAFADTDSYFGSSGPVMQFFPVQGSFEANPPFCEELMEAMVEHFEKLLAQSNSPLSFIIFIPEWRDPTPLSILRMESSRYKRKQVLIPAFEHQYRSGLQHVTSIAKEVYFKAVHGTMVFFLQNSEGFAKWPPTQDRLRNLFRAFCPDT
uniref:Phosphorylated CTD-interacting factor 1-like n=1 Tax=Phallusia mammillata TaxID=59560 RepID=A0A6F9DNZ3_9ASCI|nr:phosphorylated CTD-interacting factor 1-like [Phallusia mammillata]